MLDFLASPGFWQNVGVGILSGVIASAIFLAALFRLRPSIGISPFIAHDTLGEKPFFAFKIVNKGSRPVINVRVDASLAVPRQVEGGHVYQTRNIPLVKSEVFQIGGYSPNDKEADYACRFVTYSRLDADWKDGTGFVRLRVIATDSLSGFSAAFVQEFRTKTSSIRHGYHAAGKSLDVS
jgi:hypothetical protein